MKQKTRFTIFGNIGHRYQSMNGWYIGIGLKKVISGNIYIQPENYASDYCRSAHTSA